MHLWPSMRLRDSFNSTYLKKLDWNLRRMKSQKKQQTDRTESSSDNQQKLLNDDDDTEKGGSFPTKILVICRELLLILSCCYCCFCCGACVDGEDS